MTCKFLDINISNCAVLLQTASGTVEAKVTCFYRRRDLSSALIALADKHHSKHCLIFDAFYVNR